MRNVVQATQTDAVGITTRVGMLDWTSVSTHFDDHGWAMVEKLLTADERETMAGLYDDDGRFRSHVVMARHGFGRGEYKYFTYPLPDIVADLRRAIYPNLAPIANRWNESMGIDVSYPDAHADFIARCHKAGQTRPTPLLLQYAAGDVAAIGPSRARRELPEAETEQRYETTLREAYRTALITSRSSSKTSVSLVRP